LLLGVTKFLQRLVMNVLVRHHKINSVLQRRSAASFADFFFCGKSESISSFQRTASSKVMWERCGNIPFLSGNSKPGESRRT